MLTLFFQQRELMEKLNPYTASFVLASTFLFTQTFQPVEAAGCQILNKETLERKADPYDQSIRSAAQKYGVKEGLVKAVITVESCFKQSARGSSGEKGLMQLMPSTARRFNFKSSYSPWHNIHAGTRYLSYLLQRYDGDLNRTVAAKVMCVPVEKFVITTMLVKSLGLIANFQADQNFSVKPKINLTGQASINLRRNTAHA